MNLDLVSLLFVSISQPSSFYPHFLLQSSPLSHDTEGEKIALALQDRARHKDQKRVTILALPLE